MHRFPKTRPFVPVNAARLAAEAAFSSPPTEESKPASQALVIVKKKRHVDAPAIAAEAADGHEHDADRAPRIFRVPGLPHAEPDAPDEPSPEASATRRSRRPAAHRSSPAITLSTAPVASGVDLAALALELETSMAAREHAAVEAQLDRLQAQLGELDRVLAGIAKAREFTLSDNSLSGQWQELAQTADRLLEGLPIPA
jgi:hypothetical protein